MHDAAEQHARDDGEQQADHGQPTVAIEGIGASRWRARRDADRRIVEPQHQRVALDAAGRQPVSGARARRDPDLERAVGAADDFLAGEAVALQRIGDQMALGVVQRQRPEPRRRRHAADDHVAAAVERLASCRRWSPRRRRRRRCRSAVRRCGRSRRANRDRRRRCRSCGRAVQAPIVSVPRSVPRVAVIQVAPRPTAVASISASKVMKISRTVSSCAAAGLAARGRLAPPPQSCPGMRPSWTTPACAGFGGSLDGGLARGLAGLVEHLFDAHQNVRAALGQHRRRSRLGVQHLRRAVGRARGGSGGGGSFVPMPMPGISLISTP